MGIKTKFNPMGGHYEYKQEGDINDWTYSNTEIADKTLLYQYNPQPVNLYGYSAWSNETYEYTSKNWFLTGNPVLGQHPRTQYGVPNRYSYINEIINSEAVKVNNMASYLKYYKRKPEIDTTNTLIFKNNTVIVPTLNGRAILNDYGEGDTAGFLPFYAFNKTGFSKVDLQGVPFRNNSMYLAFYSTNVEVYNISNTVTNMANAFALCAKWNQNIQIPNSVTNMSNTFYNCRNLNQNIQIPNSVIDMSRCFSNCNTLNQNIQIPNSVTNMTFCFANCKNLNQNIQIPNSVTTLMRTFDFCYNLNQNIQIPNSVTYMSGTFYCCYNLNQNIQIPNSVIDMAQAFWACHNLNQNIQIPNSVTNIGNAFRGCNIFEGQINILSTEIANAAYFMTNNNATRKNVYIYFRYKNNALTKTYNTFKSSPWWYANGQMGSTNILTNRHNCYIYNMGKAPW